MPASQDVIDAFVAAAHGDAARVKALLAEHPDLLNARASWNETALGAAAQTGQVEIAEHLLAAGAPLDLCTAAMLGRQEAVARLLTEDPRGPHATGAHDLPVLYHAAIRGHTHVAELLLAYGADVNAGAGRTPALHGAVMFNQPAMAAWLLAHGADPNVRNRDGKTALRLALDSQRDDVAEVLRRHGARED